MVKVENALELLEGMLAEALPDLTAPTVEAVWPILKEFYKVPVDGVSDFLFQCGVDEFWGGEVFRLEFIRQFSVHKVNSEGVSDYDHMEHLSCDFQFEVTPELRAVRFGHWADEEAPLEEFFAWVESSPIFQLLKTQAPIRFFVCQDLV